MLIFPSAGSLEHPYAHLGCLRSEKAQLEPENVIYILYASNFDNVGSSSSAGFFLPVRVFKA